MTPVPLLPATLSLLVLTASLARASDAVAAPPDLERGRRVYDRACATCHGTAGKGDGPTAASLGIRPRNFTLGMYRFRTTPSGALASDEDLVRSVTYGAGGTEMPAWGGVLPPADIRAVVSYLKTMTPRFATDPPAASVAFPPPSADGPEVRERGRALYAKMQCASCHGDGGRGDGPSMATLRDDEGRPLPAADLTMRDYKGGTQPSDVERAILTGLDGAAMPSYAGTMTPDEVAALARYVLSLRRPRSVGRWLLEKVR